MLAVLTLVILGGTQALNGYFLSPFSIKSILSFFSILTFLSSAQLATVLVGAIDLSIGPLAGFASCWPRSSRPMASRPDRLRQG